jgi:thiamine biosynthesis lipoprotein
MRPRYNLQFDAIGTTWVIAYDASRQATTAVRVLIERFDQTYSRFRSDSFVRSIAQEPGRFILPDDAEPLLSFYKQLYVVTEGKVTPLIGQLMADAGYDANYSLVPGELPAVPVWDDVLNYDHPLLQTYEPVLLDFGAAGKGYLIDLIANLFEERGVTNYVINAGGDIFIVNREEVALENPNNINEAIGVATIEHQAICGSAGNRRKWAQFTHIIDPFTKESPMSIAGTWVIADSAMIADGLATALFFTDPMTLRQSFSFEHAIVTSDGLLDTSDGFPADFFIKQQKVNHEKTYHIYR